MIHIHAEEQRRLSALADKGLHAGLDCAPHKVIGVDGGGLDDLLGVCVIGRERETKRWLAWFKAFADRGVLRLRKDIASSLLDFEADGDLAFVDIGADEGLNEDVDGVADIVQQVWEAGLLPEQYGIGLDPVGVSAITDEIARREIPVACMTAVPQGYRLSGVIKGAARKLKDGTLVHGGQRIAGWCVGNAKAELRGSAVVITKYTAGSAKIDPLLAMFNAFDLMARNPNASSGPSAYETADLVVI
jgi:phage terminase large subunit-like protein